MRGRLSGLFGMEVRVADVLEWQHLVDAARKAGAVDVGNADRTDHDIVIDEKAGIIFVNPKRGPEILEQLRAAVPEQA